MSHITKPTLCFILESLRSEAAIICTTAYANAAIVCITPYAPLSKK